jgi:hypothetical protein
MPALAISHRKFMRKALVPRRPPTSGARVMLDLVYLALGIGLFALMGLYARWAANA